MSEEKKVTAIDIYRLLVQKYTNGGEWIVAGEVQRTTGWSDRRYDFVAMNCYSSREYKIEVVEIKVSKPDLRRELEEPEKHNVIFNEIDYFSLAAPAEIIDMDIIPPKWGVYAVKDGKLITKRKPLALHDESNTTIKRSFAASFLRAAMSQNIERKLLHDQLKQSYDNGYLAGKKESGGEHFDEVKKECDEYRRILFKLGFPIYWRNRMAEEAADHLQHLMKCRDVVERLDIDKCKYSVEALEHRVKAMKEAMAALGEIQSKCVSTLLKPDSQLCYNISNEPQETKGTVNGKKNTSSH